MSEFAISTWLFDSLLVTSALMAAILLLRRPVAKMFGAGVAYALWLIPAARLLMPSLTGEAVPIGESTNGVSDAVRESILAGLTTVEPATTAVAASPGIDFAALAITIWLGGAVLFFIVQMIRYASMRDDLLSDAAEIAVIDGVRVVASDQVAGPLAFGLFKRFIAVPQDFTKSYSPTERELAIAHEMAHHKSGDLFANLAAFTVLCLMWFNPLAWASWSAFRFDQEAACDARVLAGRGAEERVIYGQALARTAFDGVPTFATALNSPKTIIERLRRLTMKDASSNRRIFGKLGVIAAAAVVLPLTATIVPAVVAHDEAAAEGKPETIKYDVRAIRLKRDGTTIDIAGHEGSGGEVTKVERGGKTFIFRTDKKLSEEEVEKWIEHAEKSREAADEARIEADQARAEAEAEVEAAHGEADAAREDAVARSWAEREDAVAGSRAEREDAVARSRAEREDAVARSRAEREDAVARGHAEAMRVKAVGLARSHVGVNIVPLIPGKVGFPMTEATYLAIRKSTTRWTNEKELLAWTLTSLNAARESYARKHGDTDKRDREILDALDREIGHLKSKINRS